VLHELRPALVHTRNLPTLEFQSVAALAGVRARIHGEHGRDIYDLDGSNRKYILLRKALSPFVSRYTAVSYDLAQWLVGTVGLAAEKVVHICNGVDTQRFYPNKGGRLPMGPDGFVRQGTLIVGTVGRMQTVKDQLTLVRAFIHLIQTDPEAQERLRLVMIGDGPLREESQKLLRTAGAEALAWLPGERAGIPDIMRAMDLFVLPSIAEGISNTILEAMASGLPVVATNVGGNPELVKEGQTGTLVPASDLVAMANAIQAYLRNPGRLREHGRPARDRVERLFSIDAMIKSYLRLYDTVIERVSGKFPAKAH
jgi:sugar transferase (PEP-CTERM/EpsH1 system associated)